MAAPKCGRKAKSTGEPCTRPAGPGGIPCRFHGGAAKKLRAVGHLRLAEQRATELLARMDVEPTADPLRELSKLAGQVLAWRDVCADMVNKLTSVRYDGGEAAGEQLRAEVALFERALDRCTTVLVAIAKLDIDARLARISEAQAEVVVRALEAGLTAAAVEGPAVARARAAVERVLRSAA